MASSDDLSHVAPSERFPRARLQITARNSLRREQPCVVRLAISHRLYFKVENENDPLPSSLYDFKNHSSLTFTRLEDAEKWDTDIASKVTSSEDDVLGLEFRAHLHGRARWTRLNGAVDVILIASTQQERDKWISEISLRICPASVLQERALFLKNTGSPEFDEVLLVGSVARQHIHQLAGPAESNEDVSNASGVMSSLYLSTNKVDWIDKINLQLGLLAGSIATFVKKTRERYGALAGTAQDVADYSRIISGGASSIFQLIAVSARVAVMLAEADRGKRILPDLLQKLVFFLNFVAQSVNPIMESQVGRVDAEVAETLVTNVFEVLVKTFDIIGKIEEQLVRGSWGRFLHSSVVKEIESELEKLKQMVVSVALSREVRMVQEDVMEVREDLNDMRIRVDEGLEDVRGDVADVQNWIHEELQDVRGDIIDTENRVDEGLDEVRGTVADVENRVDAGLEEVRGTVTDVENRVDEGLEEVRGAVVDIENRVDDGLSRLDDLENLGSSPSLLPSRPDLSLLFAGRENELKKLRDIVERRGSVVITGLGGLGKTQLMVAFAERAEHDGVVPGGVFWVTADGEFSLIVESLAKMADHMRGRRMSNEDRVQPRVVVGVLKEELAKIDGRWLICLDNVDEAGKDEVSGLLDKLARMVHGVGWLIVTSRAGCPKFWMSMKLEQNLMLGPLSTEDAMYVLLKMREEETDDSCEVCLERYKERWPAEFEALRELCGCDWRYSLAGLPLALVQAGAYICLFKCSFLGYLKTYRDAVEEEKVDDILERSKEFDPVRPEQRAILTTWLISVNRLSSYAFSTLRAISFLGNAAMPADLLKRVLKEVSEEGEYGKVILKELVFGSSMLREWQIRGAVVFDMHRLVRLFILVDMKREPGIWNTALDRAMKSTHSCVEDVLPEAEKNFGVEPDRYDDRRLELVPHTFSILRYCWKRKSTGIDSHFFQMHCFTGVCLRWIGKFSDAAIVFAALLELFNRHGPESEYISVPLHELGTTFYLEGKLDQAEKMYLKGIETLHAIHGTDPPDPDVAVTYHQLGVTYQAQGQLGKAESLYNTSLKMKRGIHGANVAHPSVAATIHQLGNVYQLLGKHDEAETMFIDSLNMKIAIHGSDEPNLGIAASFHQLGLAYQHQGKLSEAEDMIVKGLEMSRAIHGLNACHPEIATSLHQLGIIHLEHCNLDEAEALFNECLEMERTIHGAETPHPSISKTLNELGRLYRRRGKLEEAESSLNKSLEMEWDIHGSNASNPDIAGRLHQLGIVYQDQLKFDEAEEKFRQSLGMKLIIYGPETPHPDVAASWHQLGMVYEDQGNRDLAESMYNKSLSMKLEIYGNDSHHPSIVASLNNLGLLHIGQRDRRRRWMFSFARAAFFVTFTVRLLSNGDPKH